MRPKVAIRVDQSFSAAAEHVCRGSTTDAHPAPGNPPTWSISAVFINSRQRITAAEQLLGLLVFGKAKLKLGTPRPFLFFPSELADCCCSPTLASQPAGAVWTAATLPLLQKHPVPYLGRRLFFNFLEHLN